MRMIGHASISVCTAIFEVVKTPRPRGLLVLSILSMRIILAESCLSLNALNI